MPKKLEDCIKKVMADGTPRSQAIPICVKSTGLKMKNSEVQKLLNQDKAEDNYVKSTGGKFWRNI